MPSKSTYCNIPHLLHERVKRICIFSAETGRVFWIRQTRHPSAKSEYTVVNNIILQVYDTIEAK